MGVTKGQPGCGVSSGVFTPVSEVTGNQVLFYKLQDIEAKKEAQKEKEIDEQEANASTFHRSRTPLDKDLINTGIYESSGKQCLPLVQLIQQLLRWVAWVLFGGMRGFPGRTVGLARGAWTCAWRWRRYSAKDLGRCQCKELTLSTGERTGRSLRVTEAGAPLCWGAFSAPPLPLRLCCSRHPASRAAGQLAQAAVLVLSVVMASSTFAVWMHTCVTLRPLSCRNIAAQTVARLKDVARRISSCLEVEQHSRDRSASLDLLLRFQRLLISKLYPGESVGPPADAPSKWLQMSVSACSGCATRRAARARVWGLHSVNASIRGTQVAPLFFNEYVYVRLISISFLVVLTLKFCRRSGIASFMFRLV